ncbi:sensor histidine kinase [Dokdonella soli]|uniref:histidine kinase n=1 Tax=Dokdonella soli TaxID=529810 RepID=A0ABN1IHG1_9GAMM
MKPAHDPTDIEALNQRLGQLMNQHHELFERLKQGQRHFQRLARSVWRVQEEERRRLARELHDGIGQNLTALIRQLDAALAVLPPDATAARARIEQACALNHATLEDTRALSRLLRPQILDDLGLEAALSWLARTIGEHHGLRVVLNVSRSLPPLDSDLSTLIFRVVQEALTNVVKHAAAAHAEVSLRVDRDAIELRVDDDGRGCEPNAALASGTQGHSSGLGGMRDRVHLFSGEFRLESTPGHGCRVVLRLPLPPEEDPPS